MKSEQTVPQRTAQAFARVIVTRSDLRLAGMTGRDITASVRAGTIVRLRRDRYAVRPVTADIAEAVRIGGRLSCLSLLRMIGVFVLTCTALHVHVVPGTSRVRAPRASTTRVHWDAVTDDRAPLHVGSLRDAVRLSIRCQPPRAAIATLDSVLHHGLLSAEELREIFEGLPARFRPLIGLVDASAESGPETFVRLVLRSLGVRFETQVTIPGIGRVDFLVEGWLIVECDSRAFHEGWDKQVDDRRRDIAAARAGYVTVRPLATDILDGSDTVRRQLAEVIDAFAARLGAHNSSSIPVRSGANAGTAPAGRRSSALHEEL
ncbi:hypothetical protein OED01_15615 [Microbacterium sp. M28]|uniref:hypothetical protein n=1 Tax=Microbacterium sp. M28 TaxID=2962064 RepID=UPI0021F4C8D1|nr:hypothetical protein [Microbacterium sp. M28]UYO97007.1 hypothetical protein OED01_15615 [Microbacterium sp. M28]